MSAAAGEAAWDDAPATRRPEDDALLRLLQLGTQRYEQLLAIPAEYALERLGATTVSLVRWERDRGLLRGVVNVGDLAGGEEHFPLDEVFDLAVYESVLDFAGSTVVAYSRDDPDLGEPGATLLARRGRGAALSVPVRLDDRMWGVLWATWQQPTLPAGSAAVAGRVASAAAPMIALAERLQSMARLAFEDPLTGLGNRRLLDDTLSELLRAEGPGCTVLMCDVNGLKAVNDAHGHEEGDRVLVAVADHLAAAVSAVPGAVAVRLGGDEFTAVLPGLSRSGAIRVVEAAAAGLGGEAITVSCGIAAVSAGTSAREALAVADAAQYAAKRRHALLVVASDVRGAARTDARRRSTDLRPAPLPAQLPVHQSAQAAIAHAVRVLTDTLPQAPPHLHGRLEWLGEALLEPFDLDHWTVSDVALDDPPHRLVVASMGMRVGRPLEQTATDLMTDHVFELADYPLTAEAIRATGWFGIDALDPATDPAERTVLETMGKRYVLAVGCRDGVTGALLELYGRSDQLDLRLLGSALGLGASAVLGQVVAQVGDTRARMAP